MIHFSCDGCGSVISPGEARYVVRVEVYAAVDETCSSLSDDADHLEEIEDLLERVDDFEQEVDDQLYRLERYDLCQACRERFLRNPLGRVAISRNEYSEN